MTVKQLAKTSACCAGLGMMMLADHKITKTDELKREILSSGVRTLATVTDKRIGWSASGRAVDYSFQVGRRTYIGLSEVSLDRFRVLSIGSKIDVRYLPTDPNVSGYALAETIHEDKSLWYAGWTLLEAGLIGLGISLARTVRSRAAMLVRPVQS